MKFNFKHFWWSHLRFDVFKTQRVYKGCNFLNLRSSNYLKPQTFMKFGFIEFSIQIRPIEKNSCSDNLGDMFENYWRDEDIPSLHFLMRMIAWTNVGQILRQALDNFRLSGNSFQMLFPNPTAMIDTLRHFECIF